MAKITFTTEIVHRPWKEILKEALAGPHSDVTYSFPEQLATIPIPQTIEVYNWVFDTTSVDHVVRDAMLPLWLHGHLYQKRDLSAAALSPLLSPGIRFGWPLMDTWAEKARSLNIWPERWQNIAQPKGKGRIVADHALIRLLDLFISFKISNLRDASNHHPSSLMHRWGWDLRTFGDSNSKLVEGMEANVTLGDWRTYPPFFPGDDTSIMLKPRPAR